MLSTKVNELQTYLDDVKKHVEKLEEKSMKARILKVFLCGLLALQALAANAFDSAPESEQVFDYVVYSLAAGTTPGNIIRSLDNFHDMSLTEATVFSMVVVGEANYAAFAAAGIRQAANLEEALEVAVAAKVVDSSDNVVAAVERALNKFIPQPDVYKDNYTNYGGAGVSPAS